MPLRKLDDPTPWAEKRICFDREHNVPGMIVLPPGAYEHTCPSCGARKLFRVNAYGFTSAGS
jgi:hypothetical protein